AGVYHVLAVSGFNVVLLAAAVLALCRLARVGRRVSAVAAIVVVVGFAAVVGPEPSVLRAVVMAVLVLAALLLEREASVTNSLALAALAILAIRPGDLLDPGFQLSFAATAGIVAAPMPRGVIARAQPRSASTRSGQFCSLSAPWSRSRPRCPGRSCTCRRPTGSPSPSTREPSRWGSSGGGFVPSGLTSGDRAARRPSSCSRSPS